MRKAKEKNNTKLIIMIVVAIIFVMQLCVPFFIIMSNAAETEGYTKITFEDENMLRAVIWELEDIEIIRIGMNLYVLPEDILNRTELNLTGNSIINITGIEAFSELTTVNLSNNKITDITNLGGLTKLTDLNLSNNMIKDITNLGSLSSLTTLNLSSNKIEDVTALERLTELTSLDLSKIEKLWNEKDNSISITGIENLVGLTSLNLSNNMIKDITKLSNLSSLTTLNLSNNRINDITELPNIENLNLTNQVIEYQIEETVCFDGEDVIEDLPQIFNDDRVEKDSTYSASNNNGNSHIIYSRSYINYSYIDYYSYYNINSLIKNESDENQIKLINRNDYNHIKIDISGGIAAGTRYYIDYKVSNISINVQKKPSILTGNTVDVNVNIETANKTNTLSQVKYLENIENNVELTEESFSEENNLVNSNSSNSSAHEITGVEENRTDAIFVKDSVNNTRIYKIVIDNIVAKIIYSENEDGYEIATLEFIEDSNNYVITNNNGSNVYTITNGERFTFEFKNKITGKTGTAKTKGTDIKVIFKDENMYKKVKENIDKMYGEQITFEDLGYSTFSKTYSIVLSEQNIQAITILDLSNANISDISGIEYFKALEEINLSNNHCTNDTININLWKLQNLRIINLQNSGFRGTIDGKNFNYSNLEELYLTKDSSIFDVLTIQNIEKGFILDGTIENVINVGVEGEPVTVREDICCREIKNSYLKGNVTSNKNVTIENLQLEGDIILYNGSIKNSSANSITMEVNEFKKNNLVENCVATEIKANNVNNCTANIIEGVNVTNNKVTEKIILDIVSVDDRDIINHIIEGNKNNDSDGYNIEIENRDIYSTIEGLFRIYVSIEDDEAQNIINKIEGNIENEFNNGFRIYGIINSRLNIKNMPNLQTLESGEIFYFISIKDANNLQSINVSNNNILKVNGLELVNVSNNVENGLALDLSQRAEVYVPNSSTSSVHWEKEQLSCYMNEYFNFIFCRNYNYIINTNITDLTVGNLWKPEIGNLYSFIDEASILNYKRY